jgi:hypothetical protein
MAESFDFTIPDPIVTLGSDRNAKTVIDVTSRLDRHELVGVDVKPDDGVDPSWFAAPEPAEFNLQMGETSRTELAVRVPPGVPPGDHRFTVRAFAISAPSQDFSVSPSLVVRVPEPQRPTAPVIPLWLLATAGGLVLAAVLAVAYLAFGGGGRPAPDLIALPASEAREAAGEGVELTEYAAPAVTSGGGCVLLQTPAPGHTTSAVSVLLVECPDPAPEVALPQATETLCNSFFSFCQDVATTYGADFAVGEDWQDASAAMIQRFVAAFRVPGDPAPDLVGLRAEQAEEVADDAGLGISLTGDTTGGAQCVLLQYPYPERPVAVGGAIAAVTTRCPGGASVPDDVELPTPIDVDSFDNVCDVAMGWCETVRAAHDDPGYLDSAELATDLALLVIRFQNAFAGPAVPDVRRLRLGPALAELEQRGLEGRYAFPSTNQEQGLGGLHPCWDVIGQSPAPGTLIASLDDNLVVLALERSVPCDVVQPADVSDES